MHSILATKPSCKQILETWLKGLCSPLIHHIKQRTKRRNLVSAPFHLIASSLIFHFPNDVVVLNWNIHSKMRHGTFSTHTFIHSNAEEHQQMTILDCFLHLDVLLWFGEFIHIISNCNSFLRATLKILSVIPPAFH